MNSNIPTVVDSVCVQFERDWNVGSPPQIADYLNKVPKENEGQLFFQLLTTDIELRADASLPIDFFTLKKDFPDFEECIEVAERKSLGDALAKKLVQLSLPERELVLLKLQAKLSTREISQRLQLSMGATVQHLKTVLLKFAK